MMFIRGAVALLAPMTVAAPAIAQTTPVRGLESLQPQGNTQAPADTTAIPIPPAPTIVLPTPTARSMQEPERSRREQRRQPDVAARTTPKPAPSPVEETPEREAPEAIASPTTTAIPLATVTPEAVAPVPVAAPTAPATTLAAPAQGEAMPFWLWLLVIPVVLVALWALRRRRPDRPPEPVLTPEPVPEPAPELVPEPTPQPVAPVAPSFLERRAPPAPRARLTVELRPLRAGLNLLSATAACELVVTNIGDAPAAGVRVGVALFTAHAGQDAELAAFNEGIVARSVTPPFALAPGETRTVRATAAIARDAIRTMTAANRPMFVPIVAANLLYASGETAGQTARAWAIGIERVDSAKLAPFWLDGPAKMYDAIAARPHAAALER